jgi:hypothetical protein
LACEKKTTLCNFTGKNLSVLSAKLGKQQNLLSFHIYINSKPKLFSGTNQKRYKKTDARFSKSIGW